MGRRVFHVSHRNAGNELKNTQQKEQGERTLCSSVSVCFWIYLFLTKGRTESVHGNNANSIYERLQRALGPEGYEYFGNEVFFLL